MRIVQRTVKPVGFELGTGVVESINDGILTTHDAWFLLKQAERFVKLSPMMLIVPKGKGISYVYNRLGGEIGIIKKTLKEPMWIKQVDYGPHQVRYLYTVSDWEKKELESDE